MYYQASIYIVFKKYQIFSSPPLLPIKYITMVIKKKMFHTKKSCRHYRCLEIFSIPNMYHYSQTIVMINHEINQKISADFIILDTKKLNN